MSALIAGICIAYFAYKFFKWLFRSEPPVSKEQMDMWIADDYIDDDK